MTAFAACRPLRGRAPTTSRGVVHKPLHLFDRRSSGFAAPLATRISPPLGITLRTEAQAADSEKATAGSDVPEKVVEEVVAPTAVEADDSEHNPLLDPSSLRPLVAAIATLIVIGLDALDGPGHASVAIGGLTAFLALLPDSGKAALRKEGMLGPVVLVASAIGAAVGAVQKGTDPATKAIREVSSTVSPLLPSSSTKSRSQVAQPTKVEPTSEYKVEHRAEVTTDVQAQHLVPHETEEAATARAHAPAPASPPTHSSATLPPAVTSAMATSLGEGQGKVMVSNGPGLGKAAEGEKLKQKRGSAIGGLVACIVTLGLSAFGTAVWLILGKGASITETLPGGLCAVAVLLMLLAAVLLSRRPPSGGSVGWAA